MLRSFIGRVRVGALLRKAPSEADIGHLPSMGAALSEKEPEFFRDHFSCLS